jgi:hypothetical protein
MMLAAMSAVAARLEAREARNLGWCRLGSTWARYLSYCEKLRDLDRLRVRVRSGDVVSARIEGWEVMWKTAVVVVVVVVELWDVVEAVRA